MLAVVHHGVWDEMWVVSWGRGSAVFARASIVAPDLSGMYVSKGMGDHRLGLAVYMGV